ncbi:MAG: MBL fold metallo-hydrolase [Candidatus Bathyarchaeota archaeon]|nr:MBL fold metallo-hydrolase [Candidatus Bathyarchaeota archaeon]
MSSIKSLKVTTLAENLVMGGGLGQWGLSLLFELVDAKGDPRKIIMDTATVPKALLHNIEHMKLDLSDVDCLVLSHNHYDHTSANVEILALTGGVKVHAHTDLFNPHIRKNKKGKTRDIGVPKGQGLPEIEAAGGEVVLNNSPIEVVPGVWTTGEVPRKSFETPMELREGTKLLTEKNGEWVTDNILDDQSLWMNLEGFGTVVASGCAHAGPVNILNHAKKLAGTNDIACFIGGTHLAGRNTEYLKRSIAELEGFGFKLFSPCHCTGFKATSWLWETFPKEFILNYCCREIDLLDPPKNRVI